MKLQWTLTNQKDYKTAKSAFLKYQFHNKCYKTKKTGNVKKLMKCLNLQKKNSTHNTTDRNVKSECAVVIL